MKTPSTEVSLETPCVLVDWQQLEANVERLAMACREKGLRCMPHIKTHKSVAIARLQLAHGAEGLTCAKISEAEAMLPSGVRRIFLANSIASPGKIARLVELQSQLDELILAVTSLAHARHLGQLLDASRVNFPVLLALDSGLHREGVRSLDELKALKDFVDQSKHFDYRGIYTHEGFTYASETNSIPNRAHEVATLLRDAREHLGGGELWPGCSVTAYQLLDEPGITGLRPGAYVFGDIALTKATGAMTWDQLALCVAATVVDKPEPGLALIDAGTKVFSSDKFAEFPFALPLNGDDYALVRMSEEHGFVTGPKVDDLAIGEILYLVPSHVCPVANLTDNFQILKPDGMLESSPVDARGCVS